MRRTKQEAALMGLIAGTLAKASCDHPLIRDVRLYGADRLEVDMADGTPTGHTMQVLVNSGFPERGDAVANWIKEFRDQCASGSAEFRLIDMLLDNYRLHADTGTPLNEEVDEGGIQ